MSVYVSHKVKICSLWYINRSSLKRCVSDFCQNILTEHPLFFALRVSVIQTVILASLFFMIELALSPEGPPVGSPEEELLPIPSLNVEESSEPGSVQPGTVLSFPVYMWAVFVVMRFEISFLFEP